MSRNSVISTREDAPFNLANSGLSPLHTTLFLSFLIPLILFTLVSNFFVIYSVSMFRPLKSPSNLFILSLALTDFLCGMCIMPIGGYYTVVGVWQLGTEACQLWYVFSYYLNTTSVYHLCVIALDRYMAIAKPLSYAKNRRGNKSVRIIFLTWSWSAVVLLPWFLDIGWPEQFHEYTPCSPIQDPSHVIYGALMSFYLPLLVLVAIYLRVFIMNRKRLKKRIKVSSERLTIFAMAMSEIPTPINELSSLNDILDEETHERVIKNIKKGSKRRLLMKMSADVQSKLCQVCSTPNNLLLAAERSRVAILMQRERRSMLIILIIICTFIVCWVPGCTVCIILNLYPSVTINPGVISAVWWLCYSNSACNPVIYTIFNRDFRDAFNVMIGLAKESNTRKIRWRAQYMLRI